MAKRRQITETLDILSIYEFEGDIGDIISTLEDIQESYDGDIYLSVETNYQYCGEESREIHIKRRRDETDDEQAERLNREKAQKANFEQKEREQYEKLKKKYG